MSLKYGIIGTGAIGGYYGAKLAKAGNDVHFLFHNDYEYVKANGLQVDSVNGSFHLSDLAVYHNTKDMPQCDVVLVCLKSTNNYLLRDTTHCCRTRIYLFRQIRKRSYLASRLWQTDHCAIFLR